MSNTTDNKGPGSRGAVRVLVVEDEPLIAMMLGDTLSDIGYSVVGPVENLKSAIHLAATERIDTAVVDINIDGQIADTVADKLMERGIPFLFVTGYPRKLGLRYSAIPLLRKPFSVGDLHRAVEDLLQTRPARG
jgi:DNA-binding response OmpR family regulator